MQKTELFRRIGTVKLLPLRGHRIKERQWKQRERYVLVIELLILYWNSRLKIPTEWLIDWFDLILLCIIYWLHYHVLCNGRKLLRGCLLMSKNFLTVCGVYCYWKTVYLLQNLGSYQTERETECGLCQLLSQGRNNMCLTIKIVNCFWTDCFKEAIELRLQPSGEFVIEKKWLHLFWPLIKLQLNSEWDLSHRAVCLCPSCEDWSAHHVVGGLNMEKGWPWSDPWSSSFYASFFYLIWSSCSFLLVSLSL